MRTRCVVAERTEVSLVMKSTKRVQLLDPILDNQLNEGASGVGGGGGFNEERNP